MPWRIIEIQTDEHLDGQSGKQRAVIEMPCNLKGWALTLSWRLIDLPGSYRWLTQFFTSKTFSNWAERGRALTGAACVNYLAVPETIPSTIGPQRPKPVSLFSRCADVSYISLVSRDDWSMRPKPKNSLSPKPEHFLEPEIGVLKGARKIYSRANNCIIGFAKIQEKLGAYNGNYRRLKEITNF